MKKDVHTASSKNLPPLFQHEKIAAPEGESRIVNLDDLSKSKFLPTTQAEVEKLKTLMRKASTDLSDRAVHNGLFEPVWLIQFPDKSLHIANGYHRFQAVYELAQEDSDNFEPAVYAKVFPGDEKLLWEMRLQGAGDHKKVAPARFIMFMMESFNGQFEDMPLELISRSLGVPKAERLRHKPRSINDKVWLKSLEELAQVTKTLGFDAKQVSEYLTIAQGLPEEYVDAIRTKPSREEAEAGLIPLQSALAVAKADLSLPQKKMILELIVEDRFTTEDVLLTAETIQREKLSPKDKEWVKSYIRPEHESRERLARGMKIPPGLITDVAEARSLLDIESTLHGMQNIVSQLLMNLFVQDSCMALSKSSKEALIRGISEYSKSQKILRENRNIFKTIQNGEAASVAKQLEEAILPYLEEHGEEITAARVEKLLSAVKLKKLEQVTTAVWKEELIASIVESLRDFLDKYFVPIDEYRKLWKK